MPAGGRTFLVSAALLLLAPLSTAAQHVGESARVPATDPADVGSKEAIVAAVYDVISGPVGEARDWDRFRSLFIPEARLIATGPVQESERRPTGSEGEMGGRATNDEKRTTNYRGV